MESHPGRTNTIELSAQLSVPTNISGQQWWYSPLLAQVNTSKSSSVDPSMSGEGTKVGQSQLSGSVDGSEDTSKETRNKGTRTDGSLGKENQNIHPVSSVMTSMMSEYLAPHTQLTGYGQSIACVTYPVTDPYFAGVVAPYATQALVHHQIVGMPHSRMPLPLEMTEEPVFVNAKQYHGILRRRQSRAIAELARKVTKVRKPYLHESRHLHAKRRARGSGGRFLNTKKTDDSSAKTDTDKSTMPDEMPESGTSISRKNGYQKKSRFELSSFTLKPGERTEDEDCSGQLRAGIPVNRPPGRVVAI